jgi:hypothetical protein
MTVYSVFNVGSGHTRREPNCTVPALGDACAVPKVLNDGPDTLANQLTKRLDATLTALLTGKNMFMSGTDAWTNPGLRHGDVVNMTGHSRGAVLCHLLANRLADEMARLGRTITINMFLLDPVNMTKRYAGEASHRLNLNACGMLGEYRVIFMVNQVTKNSPNPFPPTLVELADPNSLHKVKPLTMPGTHGSGTQCLTSKVGSACLETGKFYLAKWGSQINPGVLRSDAFCDLFASVYQEILPATAGRGEIRIFDDGGMARSHQGKENVKGFSNKRLSAVDDAWLKNPAWIAARAPTRQYGAYFPRGYFFNRFHENRFYKTFNTRDLYKDFNNFPPNIQHSIKSFVTWQKS